MLSIEQQPMPNYKVNHIVDGSSAKQRTWQYALCQDLEERWTDQRGTIEERPAFERFV